MTRKPDQLTKKAARLERRISPHACAARGERGASRRGAARGRLKLDAGGQDRACIAGQPLARRAAGYAAGWSGGRKPEAREAFEAAAAEILAEFQKKFA